MNEPADTAEPITRTDADASPDARFRPDVAIREPDLAAVEAAVRRAIDERHSEDLVLLGNGEFSLALKWGDGDEAIVVKRVPPFDDQTLADRYIRAVDDYITDLERRDVRCVSTRQLTHRRANGSVVVYHCQPLLDPERLADRVLAAAEPSPDHPIVQGVLDAIITVVEGGGTIDAQVANWYWFEDRLWQLDFSTPISLDERGKLPYPASAFLREYPLIVRPLVLREMVKLIPPYSQVPHNVVDIMAHLMRVGLEHWCPSVSEAAAARGFTATVDEARAAYSEQLKFYPPLLKLKRFQRRWMELTRRKYDVMLPAVTSYGR
jgi:hypothetical protein